MCGSETRLDRVFGTERDSYRRYCPFCFFSGPISRTEDMANDKFIRITVKPADSPITIEEAADELSGLQPHQRIADCHEAQTKELSDEC
jgi:hypothetical protein